MPTLSSWYSVRWNQRGARNVENANLSNCGCNLPQYRVAPEIEGFQSNFSLYFSREFEEQSLSSFVGSSRRPNLVDPLVLRVVIDHQFFHEAVHHLDMISLRDDRRYGRQSQACSATAARSSANEKELLTAKELHSARRLTELIKVRKKLHFNDNIHLATDPVHCIVNRQPSWQSRSWQEIQKNQTYQF